LSSFPVHRKREFNGFSNRRSKRRCYSEKDTEEGIEEEEQNNGPAKKVSARREDGKGIAVDSWNLRSGTLLASLVCLFPNSPPNKQTGTHRACFVSNILCDSAMFAKLQRKILRCPMNADCKRREKDR
jgi:hypothetical protein